LSRFAYGGADSSGVVGILMMPWDRLLTDCSVSYLFVWIVGVRLPWPHRRGLDFDYYLVRKRRLVLEDLLQELGGAIE